MKFGSLFAGIGGMDLGLERAGMTCAWQVEIDDYATKVLGLHWPAIPRFRDVRECGAHNLERVDIICGGFPCQDISTAGNRFKRQGISGKRSGLWAEYARIVGELRPRYVLIENSPALLDRGLDKVLCDLAALGFDAEWEVISACAFGAPHSRERLFLVAHANGDRLMESEEDAERERVGLRGQVRQTEEENGKRSECVFGPDALNSPSSWQLAEPVFCGNPDGVPGWVDRIRTLGNAVVPAVAQRVGELIINHERICRP